MSKKLGIKKLVDLSGGEESLKVQWLHQSLVKASKRKKDTEITFATWVDPIQIVSNEQLALIIWFPKDKIDAALQSSREEG